MSSLKVDNIQTYNSNPPVIKNASGAEVGTFCRAYVNFNGTGTVAIRASFNVSSITDSDVGYYVVNFTSALSDTNYTAVASTSDNATLCGISPAKETKTTTAMSVITREVAASGNRYDPTQVSVAIFR